jgi:hypothetical protein
MSESCRAAVTQTEWGVLYTTSLGSRRVQGYPDADTASREAARSLELDPWQETMVVTRQVTTITTPWQVTTIATAWVLPLGHRAATPSDGDAPGQAGTEPDGQAVVREAVEALLSIGCWGLDDSNRAAAWTLATRASRVLDGTPMTPAETAEFRAKAEQHVARRSTRGRED